MLLRLSVGIAWRVSDDAARERAIRVSDALRANPRPLVRAPLESALDLITFIEKLARPRICPRCADNPCASSRR